MTKFFFSKLNILFFGGNGFSQRNYVLTPCCEKIIKKIEKLRLGLEMFSLCLKFNLRLPFIKKIKLKGGIATKSEILEMLRKMPREKHLGKPKFTKKDELIKNISFSNVTLKVVGNGAVGSPRSVFLFTDSIRYMFNCGEGSLRIAAEAGIRLSRLTNILVTYPSWDNIGGMINMALSLKEAGTPELCIHGHSNIETIYSNAVKFVSLRGFIITTKDCPHNGKFSDSALDVKYVHLYPSFSNQVNKSSSEQSMLTTQAEESESVEESDLSDSYEDDNLPSGKGSSGSGNIEHLARKNKRKGFIGEKRCRSELKKQKEKVTQGEYAVSYICQTKPTLGKLLYTKCIELGVPPGPELGKLKNGEDITLKDGTIVRSSDVKESDIPGAVIIFIECPTEDYLDSLLREPAYRRHQSGELSPVDIASVVVHFTSSKVLNTPKYQEWINRFSKETKHLYINEDNKCVGSLAVHRIQNKLNMLDPDIFPLLQGCSPSFSQDKNYEVDSGHSVVKCLTEVKKSSETNEILHLDTVFCKCESNPHISGKSFTEINIRPVKPYDYSECFILNREKFLENILADTCVKEKVEEYKLKVKEFQFSGMKDERIYPKIVFLGTGSSKPSTTRNTSGILVLINKDKGMILDCGESTYNQLVRLFGKEQSDEILRNLKMIYVSHIHADHHTGMITLLKKRKDAFQNSTTWSEEGCSSKGIQNEQKFYPVLLLAPVQLNRWLYLYNKEFEPIMDLFNLFPNTYFLNEMPEQKDCLDSLALKEIRTTLVRHCPDAFGVAVVHQDGWKLTYSGDTMPCNDLVKLGQNSDILIHEATHDDSLVGEAKRKMHSTTSQAIEIGKKMNAKYILLTHFSQRYPYVPVLREEFKNENVGIAFDNMILNYNQLPFLSQMNEALKIIFAQNIEKLEERVNLQGLKRKLMEENHLSKKCMKASH